MCSTYFTFTCVLLQLQVAQLVKQYPVQCESLLLARKRKSLTAIEIYDLFVPRYSPEGSNSKEKEVTALSYWMMFLEECQGTTILYSSALWATNPLSACYIWDACAWFSYL